MERRDPPRVGELLRHHRTAAALSQEALAERAGLSSGPSAIWSGIHRAPRLETVRLLADALKLGETERAELLAAAHPQVLASVEHEAAQPPAWLPVPLTRLVGRETDMAAVRQILAQEDVRLVTSLDPEAPARPAWRWRSQVVSSVSIRTGSASSISLRCLIHLVVPTRSRHARRGKSSASPCSRRCLVFLRTSGCCSCSIIASTSSPLLWTSLRCWQRVRPSPSWPRAGRRCVSAASARFRCRRWHCPRRIVCCPSMNWRGCQPWHSLSISPQPAGLTSR